MLLRVTATDIRLAHDLLNVDCPLVLAAKRQLKVKVAVFDYLDIEIDGVYYKVTKTITKFMERFDDSKVVKPSTFRLIKL